MSTHSRLLLHEVLQSVALKESEMQIVGHRILVIVYHVLANRASYEELGGDYFDRQNVVQQRTRLIRKLEALGLKVTIEELPVAA